MFEFMDGVVDALEETGNVVVDGVVYCLICVAKLALIITAPVWVLPYTIWRKGRMGKGAGVSGKVYGRAAGHGRTGRGQHHRQRRGTQDTGKIRIIRT